MDNGKRFEKYRKNKGLSQKEAAEQLGIKGYLLANYESNRSEPSIDTLKKMSQLYGTSIDNLVGNRKVFKSAENYFNEDEYDLEEIKKILEDLCKRVDDISKK